MAINRSQMNRQLRMGGGIMSLSEDGIGGGIIKGVDMGSRTGFFNPIKSITKAVKGVAKGVKDVVKSDVGKAALTAAALYYGGGGNLFGLQRTGMSGFSLGNLPGASFFGKGSLNPLRMLGPATSDGIMTQLSPFGQALSKFGLATGANQGTLTGLGKIVGTTAAISGLTGYLAEQGMEEEEIEAVKQDPELLSNYLGQYYKNLNPKASPQEVANFVRVNTLEYRADGGRIGYQNGTPKEGIETLTPMKKPDGDVQYVRDMIKSLDGFAQLIAQKNNLDRQTFQNHMDLFEDFRQRKDIDPMPAYTYLKRRVEELNPEVAKMIYITQEDNPDRKTIERPEKAYGGRMGFEGGTYTFEQFLKDKQQVDKAMSMEELRREYERMMKLKNIRDTRDIAAYGGRMGFQQGGNFDFNKFLEDRTKEALQVEGIGQAIRPVVESNIRAQAARDLSQAARGGGIESFLRGQLGSGIIPGMSAIQSPMSGTSNFGRKLVLDALTKSYMNQYSPSYSTPTDSVYDQMRFAQPGQSGSFVQMLGGQFGDGMGIVIDGKQYKSEQEAIDDLGVERYNMFMADGGRIGYAYGDRAEDNAMQASNAMGLPLNQNPAGVTELDLRETGGFIPPVGVKEKADDIPAMLSNNEFVFTADAVRGMGDGDVNKGAQRMYDMMKKLENGGRV